MCVCRGGGGGAGSCVCVGGVSFENNVFDLVRQEKYQRGKTGQTEKLFEGEKKNRIIELLLTISL